MANERNKRTEASATSKKTTVDTENILMTLDQLGQTVEVMSSVLGRLKQIVQHNLDNTQQTVKPPAPALQQRVTSNKQRRVLH